MADHGLIPYHGPVPLRIVLLCPDRQDEPLLSLLEALREREVEHELVSGVDLDSRHALAAVDRYLEDGLYVICRDGDLDDDLTSELRETLLTAQLVPARHIMVLKVRQGSSAKQAGALQRRSSHVGPPLPPQSSSNRDRRGPAFETQEFEPPSSAAPVAGASGILATGGPAAGAGEVRTRVRLAILTGLGALAAVAAFELGVVPSSSLADAQRLVDEGLYELSVPATRVPEAGRAERPIALAPLVSDPVPTVDERAENRPSAAEGPGDEEDSLESGEFGLEGSPRGGESKPGRESESSQTVQEEPSLGQVKLEAQSDTDMVAAAIESGVIEPLFEFLVDPDRSKRGTFRDARSYCADREVQGVGAWRLPRLSELTSLVDARLVRRTHYWSETPGDAQQRRFLVYDGHNKKIRSLKPGWHGARAVCVRDR